MGENAASAFGSSEQEIKQFLSGWGDATIKETQIELRNYPFEPSFAYGNSILPASAIKNIDLTSAPPAVLINDELIFIRAELKDVLEAFAKINQIELVNRDPVWSWILEPFLDTEFTEETRSRLEKLLNQVGLDNSRVESIRNEVRDQMFKYNFDTMLWNWTFFDTIDVLMAMKPKYSQEEFANFHKEVMRIALIG